MAVAETLSSPVHTVTETSYEPLPYDTPGYQQKIKKEELVETDYYYYLF